MSRAAVLAAVLFAPGAPPAPVDFGPVQLGDAAMRTLRVQALGVAVSGAGFSAARTPRGVLIVFEPYELHEEVSGALTLRTRSGVVRIALNGHGVDTVRPGVAVSVPRVARAGRPLTIHFAATDNDLVATCTLIVQGHVVDRRLWPATTFRWPVPPTLRGRVRIGVIAVDRAGNRASATSSTLVAP